MIAAVPQQRAFVIWWHELDRWMVPASTIMAKRLPKGWTLAKIADLVRQVTDRIEVKPERQYKMAGVKWYGEGMFHRETVHGNETSANYLIPLKAGAFIYNRLFAWKASFAVVPEEMTDCYVSGEFPQFIVDETKLLPAYLYLNCTSSATVRAVRAASTGSAAVSRNRFREEFFLDFEIPLPPLSVQWDIVTKWEKAKADIADTRRQIAVMEDQIEADLLVELGLSKPKHTASPKALTVWWRNFERWSVSFNQFAQNRVDLGKSRYPVVSIGSIIDRVQYGSSEKANSGNKGIPIIRMNNIVDGMMDFTDLKYLQLSQAETKRLLLNDGDILFNRTNSKELVGKCAVYHSTGEYVFASYLIRVKVTSSKAVPDYLAFVVNSTIGRQQIDMLSRQIIGQANINSKELRSLLIPLPPLDIQRKLVEKIELKRKEIIALKADVAQMTSLAKSEVDAMIVGEKRASV